MEKAKQTNRSLHFINDYYLILFGSLTGMRVSEVCGVRYKDVGTNNIQVVGKGQKSRSIPIGRRGKRMIVELTELKTSLMNQHTEPNSLLFMNRANKPFTRFAINRRFDYWRVRSGITRRINYHSLRHYFATYLLNSGFLIHEVQRFLGHSSPATTSQYLHFTKKTFERVENVL